MRLWVVAGLLGVFALAGVLHARWTRALQRPVEPGARLPARLLSPARRTWVIFTTPFCASCGSVAERLTAAEPGSGVVTVDATAEPELARAFSVRSAPTALLADQAGEVEARLVGAAAVDRYVRSPQ